LGKEDLAEYTKSRRFETRLGERIEFIKKPADISASLQASAAEYVIVGIPEDIGVKANLGIAGTASLWSAFLSAFLNMQNNEFLDGGNILIPGAFNFNDLKAVIESNAHSAEEKTEAYRHAVNTIDEEVEALIKLIVIHHKMPIVIGGGHNNGYPLIKGAAKGLQKAGHSPFAAINCMNLDAHTDYRPMEGRHSGNAFRYAMEDGYLKKYAVIGAHENYIPQNVYTDIKQSASIRLITWEDIFIRKKPGFEEAVSQATSFTASAFTGIEVDFDAIENVVASAGTPVGVTPLHARQFIHYAASAGKPAYLHLCEGASALEDGRTSNTTGKLAAYLVSDFIKACF
jgi:formiminoglutamase